jgi:7,8-dihydro-6-hydroxymethylpterin dimethyltransferase
MMDPILELGTSRILSQTESVCPECLRRISAARIERDENVYLEKDCPEHGHFSTVVWRGKPAFSSWVRPKTPSFPKHPFTEVRLGCPYDCGLCPEHEQQSCCVLLEVTQRCDLHCPVCFADAANKSQRGLPPDLTMGEIDDWYKRLLEAGGPFNIQLSGGEPCVRKDLPDIISLGRSHGFTFFQLNTNGLRLAGDSAYLAELKSAGLSTVFLQFDGTTDVIYQRIRGRALFEKKMAVIEHCAEQGVGMVLVPTLIPGINTQDIGNVLRLALAHMPTVRGVHFQPISYFGRYEVAPVPGRGPQEPRDEDRVTIPEVIRAIEEQTEGLFQSSALCPPGGENAQCSFHGNYVLMPDGALKALTRHKEEACCCTPTPAAEGAVRSREFVAEHWSAPIAMMDIPVFGGPSLGEWDVFLERKRTHTFCVSGMAFQDAWTLDLDRLRDCYIHTASPDGRLVPFCAYNLTDRQGRSLYRKPAIEQTI